MEMSVSYERATHQRESGQQRLRSKAIRLALPNREAQDHAEEL